MSDKPELVIVSLYPRDMNIYGDRGNILSLTRRASAHGYEPRVIDLNVGDELPEHIDIVIGGGGQDSGQARVAADLAGRAGQFRELADAGTPMLVICGLYQLFGHRFVTASGATLEGIGVLDVETRGGAERMIGNVVVESADFGEIIGYENHSGFTVLGEASEPLGRVTQARATTPTTGLRARAPETSSGATFTGRCCRRTRPSVTFLSRRPRCAATVRLSR